LVEKRDADSTWYFVPSAHLNLPGWIEPNFIVSALPFPLLMVALGDRFAVADLLSGPGISPFLTGRMENARMAVRPMLL